MGFAYLESSLISEKVRKIKREIIQSVSVNQLFASLYGTWMSRYWNSLHKSSINEYSRNSWS